MEPSPLRLQALVGAAERLRSRGGRATDWTGCVELALDRLRRRPFEAQAVRLYGIRKDDKRREVAETETVDRLIEEALLPLVARAAETRLSDAVHGYRRGRSTFTAALAASRLLAGGRRHVALLDIANFFPSVRREPLAPLLEDLLGAHVAEIVLALAGAPATVDGALVTRPVGLTLGRVLSPVLSNLALLPLDDACAESGFGYVRYGDDLFVAAASEQERAAAEDLCARVLGSLGLELAEHKAQRILYSGAPFLYLGHALDERGLFERVGERRLERMEQRTGIFVDDGRGPDSRAFQPNRRVRTLYLTEPGVYVRVDQGRLVVMRGKDVLRDVPLHRVDRVLVLAGVALSSAVLSACIVEGIPMLFFVGRGRGYGSLVAGGMPNPLRLRAQYDLCSQSESRLGLARAIVDAKLRAMLRRLDRQPQAAGQRQQVAGLKHRIATAPDSAVLRGLEGAATRAWYEALALRLRPEDFRFHSRSKQPPRDPINRLLSFAYSLFFGEMQTALLAHGLDPHPGLLHDLRPGHPALASDLVEPYRVALADAFVVALVNRGQFVAGDFVTLKGGGVYLDAEPRRRFLRSFEEFVARPLGPAGSATPRQLIDGAALAMLRVVLGQAEGLELPLTAHETTPENDGAEEQS